MMRVDCTKEGLDCVSKLSMSIDDVCRCVCEELFLSEIICVHTMKHKDNLIDDIIYVIFELLSPESPRSMLSSILAIAHILSFFIKENANKVIALVLF